jgi:hypothetical protein
MQNDLAEIIWRGIWQNLDAAVSDRNNPYRTFVFSYLGLAASVESCTLVLRQADETNRSIAFHTDSRSEKFRALQKNAQSSLVFYSAKDKIQLRLQGEALLHHMDPKTKKHWNNLYDLSKQCYRQAQSAGELYDAEKTSLGLAAAYDNFAVVEIILRKIDYLFLHVKGHLRYLFDLNDQGYKAFRIAS